MSTNITILHLNIAQNMSHFNNMHLNGHQRKTSGQVTFSSHICAFVISPRHSQTTIQPEISICKRHHDPGATFLRPWQKATESLSQSTDMKKAYVTQDKKLKVSCHHSVLHEQVNYWRILDETLIRRKKCLLYPDWQLNLFFPPQQHPRIVGSHTLEEVSVDGHNSASQCWAPVIDRISITLLAKGKHKNLSLCHWSREILQTLDYYSHSLQRSQQ